MHNNRIRGKMYAAEFLQITELSIDLHNLLRITEERKYSTVLMEKWALER